MPPWHYPCVMNPSEPNPWPGNSPRAAHWRPNSEAVAVWQLLEEAAEKPDAGAPTNRPSPSNAASGDREWSPL
jgi:hypothetical protein